MRCARISFLLVFPLFAAGIISQAQVTGLSFRPVTAKYSTALDRIIFISGNPNQLHIYNPVSQADQTVALPEVPQALSLSSDGTHAAVGYSDAVSYVDLQAGSIAQTYSNISVSSPNNATFSPVVGAGYIYAIPTYDGNIVSINIATGQVTSGTFTYISAAYLIRQPVPSTQPKTGFLPTTSIVTTRRPARSPLPTLVRPVGVLSVSAVRFPFPAISALFTLRVAVSLLHLRIQPRICIPRGRCPALAKHRAWRLPIR